VRAGDHLTAARSAQLPAPIDKKARAGGAGRGGAGRGGWGGVGRRGALLAPGPALANPARAIRSRAAGREGAGSGRGRPERACAPSPADAEPGARAAPARAVPGALRAALLTSAGGSRSPCAELLAHSRAALAPSPAGLRRARVLSLALPSFFFPSLPASLSCLSSSLSLELPAGRDSLALSLSPVGSIEPMRALGESDAASR
jgi:hypothetical protein